jgi:hypothetical protein
MKKITPAFPVSMNDIFLLAIHSLNITEENAPSK